jgi:PAS domain S-box-containing protein
MPRAPKTILLVEDEAIIALAEAAQLESAGYAVLRAASGDGAVEAVEASRGAVDLILMDIDLGPGMDGTEAATRILRRFELPILFLSSHVERDIVQKTEEITNYGYVVKSSSFTVLDASIKMAFKLFETRRELALSEDKFSKAFHVNPDSININRLADGVYMDINAGFTQMTGYAAEDVIGRSSLPGDLGIWVRAEDRERLVRGLRRDGEVLNLEAEFRRKDGSTLTGLMSAHAIEVEGQECLLSITKDITEKHRAEAELKKTRLLLESLMDIPNDFFIIAVDRDFNYIQFNRAYHRDVLLRYGVDVGIGMNLLESLPGDAFLERSIPHYRRALSNEPSIEIEHNEVTGEYYETYYSPIAGEGGGVIGAIVLATNITLLKLTNNLLGESEGRWRAMLAASPDGIAVISRRGEILFGSQRSAAMLGYDDPEDEVGMDFLRFVDPADREKAAGDLRDLLEGGEPRRQEYALLRKDGSSLVVEVNPELMRTREGEPGEAIVVIRDIADRKAREEALRRLADNRQVLMKELQHRVKNSLSLVSSFLDIAKSELSDERAIAVLEDTASRIGSMSTIYENLYLSESLRTIDFAKYVEQVGKSVFEAYNVDPSRVRLETELRPVGIDTKRAISLGLILTELLTNSFKYAFPGGAPGTIRIALDAGDEAIRLTVADDGVGLPDAGMFETAQTMGMTLVRLLVGQIAGSMRVDSSRGTSVTVEFARGGEAEEPETH